MPKTSTLFAGIALVTALTYQSRINLITHTAQVQHQIDQAKEQADLITRKKNEVLVRLSLERPPSSIERFVDNTSSYYEKRLVPSVKESWNAQVMQLTSIIIQSDLPTKCSKFIMRNVFGCN